MQSLQREIRLDPIIPNCLTTFPTDEIKKLRSGAAIVRFENALKAPQAVVFNQIRQSKSELKF